MSTTGMSPDKPSPVSKSFPNRRGHRGYAVVCLGPVIKAGGVKSISLWEMLVILLLSQYLYIYMYMYYTHIPTIVKPLRGGAFSSGRNHLDTACSQRKYTCSTSPRDHALQTEG